MGMIRKHNDNANFRILAPESKREEALPSDDEVLLKREPYVLGHGRLE